MEECGVGPEHYESASGFLEKKLSIVYKRKPIEVKIGQYKTIILKFLKSNMNLQFVAGVYAMLTYLVSYLYKPKCTTSELMKKESLVIHFWLNMRFLHMKQSNKYYLHIWGIQI